MQNYPTSHCSLTQPPIVTFLLQVPRGAEASVCGHAKAKALEATECSSRINSSSSNSISSSDVEKMNKVADDDDDDDDDDNDDHGEDVDVGTDESKTPQTGKAAAAQKLVPCLLYKTAVYEALTKANLQRHPSRHSTNSRLTQY